jgi:hypothetical protein
VEGDVVKRLLCWLRGHRWHVLGINRRKNANLIHLHTMAGCYARCERCGRVWDDVDGISFFGDKIDWARHGGEIPPAKVRS